MTAFYNEIDPYAAQWLRNLIEAGHIAPGVVDERSIEDITPYELSFYTQCHFFAGIGVWSHALRAAGWPDDRPVWTGSCPCQPFSQTGKGAGFDDPRHLWPDWFWLIGQCRPPVIFGEQVASKDVDPWIDLVQADMEDVDYSLGAVPFPSAGIGAPHIRDRTYWVGHANYTRLEGHPGYVSPTGWPGSCGPAAAAGLLGGMEHTRQHHDAGQKQTAHHRQPKAHRPSDLAGGPSIPLGGLAHGLDGGLQTRLNGLTRGSHGAAAERSGRAGRLGHANGKYAGGDGGSLCGAFDREDGQPRADHAGPSGAAGGAGPTNGFWGDADWLGCRDAKWRPVEPGSFPLAHGVANRVGRLRAYGNAINAEAARVFIEAVIAQ